jgi:glycosyltransferase involved in cell wall biosynthesis
VNVRIALVTEIPAPFRLPSFSALAEEPGVELHVLFLAETDPRRSYRFDRDAARFEWSVLRGRSLLRGGAWVMLSRGVGRNLRRLRPDVILIGGWNQPAFWQAALYARRTRTPLVVWVESTARDARTGRGPLERAKRRLLGGAAATLVPGSAAAEYARALGARADRVAIAPNAVDLTLFDERVRALAPRRDELRAERGLSGFVVLYVGRLEHEKGPDVLVRAMQDVDGTLVVVGSGSLQPQLEALAPAGRVRFEGHLPPDELPGWYACADAFVMPSRSETWGMALSEAATSGLPLVATEVVGAAHDLVEPGGNGARVPSEDHAAIAAALRALAADADTRARFGRRSRELAARFTPAAWATAVAGLARRLAP